MTDHSTVPVVATGDWIDAAFINQYWGDNFRAIFQGYQAAGSLAYALDANTIAELVKPSVNSVLTNTNAGAIAWLANTAIPGRIHVGSSVDKSTSFTTSSTSYVDVTGATLNLSLGVGCTIYAFAFGSFIWASYPSTHYPYFGINIDGVDDSLLVGNNQNTYNSRSQFVTMRQVASIAAGTRTVKLRAAIAGGAVGVTVEQARLIAIAVVG